LGCAGSAVRAIAGWKAAFSRYFDEAHAVRRRAADEAERRRQDWVQLELFV
jgi:hypothetical protein